MRIRDEQPGDETGIRIVNERAFEEPAEADIVDRLRDACEDCLSLVVEDDAIVGHILFSPAIVETAGRRVIGMGLAPLAVVPERQRQGIGSMLVERGLALLRESGCPFVIVLGHPEFYVRFGFERASAHGLECEWEDVPDEAFMVLALDLGVMEGVAGVAKYRDEFAAAM